MAQSTPAIHVVPSFALASTAGEAGPLIAPIFNPALEQALANKLARITATGGAFGMLEAMAILLGVIQNSLEPSLPAVTLALAVADHGFARSDAKSAAATAATLAALHDDRLPLTALARVHDVAVRIVHAGATETSTARAEPRPVERARSTDDARAGAAMTAEQVQAALRQGMRESERARGSALVCAALGAGADTSAALVLGALTRRDPLEFAADGRDAETIRSVRERHGALWTTAGRDPVDVVAAVGGLETATLAGLMLAAASRRRLVLVDGLAALAALHVAARMAPYVADYCVPVRSHARRGIAAALNLGRPALPSPLEIDAMDGTAGILAVPVLRSAAALLATRSD